MKITQEVRDFAKANPPRDGEGDHSPLSANGGGAAALAAEDAEPGMAEMSKVFRDTGGELYLGARGREHD
jgi:phosphomethylpyrimidine synthase